MEYDNSTYYSPSSSITDSPGGNYSHNINKSITLTSGVDLNNAVAATLSFYGKWEIEAGYDYVQLEISTMEGLLGFRNAVIIQKQGLLIKQLESLV